MRPILKFGQNNFQFAFSALKIPVDSDFWETSTPEENGRMIAQDIERQRFISETDDFAIFEERWELAKTQKNEYTYIQGDMCATTIPKLFCQEILIPQLSQGSRDSKKQDPLLTLLKQIEFAYINDRAEMCGFSIMLNSQKPNQWIACIVENTTAPFKNRRVNTYLHQMPAIPDSHPGNVTYEDILTNLHSRSIEQLLKPLINEKDYTVNEDLFSLLSTPSKGGVLIPKQSTQPSMIQKIYERKIDVQSRVKQVAFEQTANEPPVVITVDLNTPLTHTDIKTYFEIRFKILSGWLKQELPFSVIMLAQEVCPFITGQKSAQLNPHEPKNLANTLKELIQTIEKDTIVLIPLHFTTHWNLLAVRVNSCQIITAEYFHSYMKDTPKILDRKSVIVESLKLADSHFNEDVVCRTHFYSYDLKASGTIVIENAIHFLRSLSHHAEPHKPLDCSDEMIAAFQAHYIKELRVNSTLSTSPDRLIGSKNGPQNINGTDANPDEQPLQFH